MSCPECDYDIDKKESNTNTPCKNRFCHYKMSYCDPFDPANSKYTPGIIIKPIWYSRIPLIGNWLLNLSNKKFISKGVFKKFEITPKN